jgi:hypothetical protein
MPTTGMTDQEVRKDFAGKLQRRFQGMITQWTCTCGSRNDDHLKPCPAYYWLRAIWVTGELLSQENGDEGE